MYSDYQTWPWMFQPAPMNSDESQLLPFSILVEPHIPMPWTWTWYECGSEWQDPHQNQHSAGPSRTRDERRNGRRQAAAPYPQAIRHELLGMISRDHPIRVGGVRRPPQESTSNLSNYEVGITRSGLLNNPAPAPAPSTYGSAVMPSTPTPATTPTLAVVPSTSTPAWAASGPSILTAPTETRKKGKQKLYTHWNNDPDDWDNSDDSDEDEKLVMKMVTMKINEC